LKGLLKALRKQFPKGTYSQFDNLLSRIADCDLETASKIRESWINLDLLGYDSDGLLTWMEGVFEK